MKNKSKGLLFLAALAVIALAAPSAFALHSDEHYSLFDDAAYVSPGNASDRAVHLVSDASPGFGGVEYEVEDGLTFAQLDQLGTDYRFEADDSCGGGSPRFQIGVASSTGAATTTPDTGNIFVYLGSAPNYTLCPSGVWLNSGDLLEGDMTVDTSQLDGGTFYDPYASSALVKYGSYTVTSVKLVADAGWAAADGEQALDVDNTMVDGTLFTYEEDDVDPEEPPVVSKDDCKKGGWMDLEDADGNSFKNQGQCVSHFAKIQNDE